MTDYSAERREERRSQKAAQQAERERQDLIRGLMAQPAGRRYVYEKLVAAHIFRTSFSVDALAMAFAEGERNQGLQLLTDVMSVCPDMFVRMMQEQHEQHSSTRGDRADGNGRDQGSEPDPSGDADDDGSYYGNGWPEERTTN